MEKPKFVKAKCKKTGRWYGLSVKQIQGRWKVVDMIDLSDSEAALLASEVKQDSFESNANLIPCSVCGGRRVAGCGCSKNKHQCSKGMKYHFDCLYCNELEIDYRIPTKSEIAGRAGETIRLSQGQEVKIRYADDRPLTQIIVGVGWDPAVQGNTIDVDSSVVVMSSRTLADELVYFKDLKHPSGCVIHHGDNLTGEDLGYSGQTKVDDENISVYLNKVPQDRDRIVFVLNIYDCEDKHQTFGRIKNLYIRLYDPDSKKVLIEYPVTGNYNAYTALIIGMAYRKDGGWVFKAIGKGSKATSVGKLEQESVDYCK